MEIINLIQIRSKTNLNTSKNLYDINYDPKCLKDLFEKFLIKSLHSVGDNDISLFTKRLGRNICSKIVYDF